jgi:hypothetical protein
VCAIDNVDNLKLYDDDKLFVFADHQLMWLDLSSPKSTKNIIHFNERVTDLYIVNNNNNNNSSSSSSSSKGNDYDGDNNNNNEIYILDIEHNMYRYSLQLRDLLLNNDDLSQSRNLTRLCSNVNKIKVVSNLLLYTDFNNNLFNVVKRKAKLLKGDVIGFTESPLNVNDNKLICLNKDDTILFKDKYYHLPKECNQVESDKELQFQGLLCDDGTPLFAINYHHTLYVLSLEGSEDMCKVIETVKDVEMIETSAYFTNQLCYSVKGEKTMLYFERGDSLPFMLTGSKNEHKKDQIVNKKRSLNPIEEPPTKEPRPTELVQELEPETFKSKIEEIVEEIESEDSNLDTVDEKRVKKSKSDIFDKYNDAYAVLKNDYDSAQEKNNIVEMRRIIDEMDRTLQLMRNLLYTRSITRKSSPSIDPHDVKKMVLNKGTYILKNSHDFYYKEEYNVEVYVQIKFSFTIVDFYTFDDKMFFLTSKNDILLFRVNNVIHDKYEECKFIHVVDFKKEKLVGITGTTNYFIILMMVDEKTSCLYVQGQCENNELLLGERVSDVKDLKRLSINEVLRHPTTVDYTNTTITFIRSGYGKTFFQLSDNSIYVCGKVDDTYLLGNIEGELDKETEVTVSPCIIKIDNKFKEPLVHFTIYREQGSKDKRCILFTFKDVSFEYAYSKEKEGGHVLDSKFLKHIKYENEHFEVYGHIEYSCDDEKQYELHYREKKKKQLVKPKPLKDKNTQPQGRSKKFNSNDPICIHTDENININFEMEETIVLLTLGEHIYLFDLKKGEIEKNKGYFYKGK